MATEATARAAAAVQPQQPAAANQQAVATEATDPRTTAVASQILPAASASSSTSSSASSIGADRSIMTLTKLQQMVETLDRRGVERTVASQAKQLFSNYREAVAAKAKAATAASTMSAKLGRTASTLASYVSFGMYGPSKPQDFDTPIKRAALAYLKAAFARLHLAESTQGFFRVPAEHSSMNNTRVDANAILDSARIKQVIADNPAIFLRLNRAERVYILTWALPLLHRIMDEGAENTLDRFRGRNDIDKFSAEHFVGFLTNLTGSCAGDMYKHLKAHNPDAEEPATLMNALGFDYHPESGALVITGSENLGRATSLVRQYHKEGPDLEAYVTKMELAQALRFSSNMGSVPDRHIIGLAVNTQEAFLRAIGL